MKKMHSEELHSLHSSPNIIRMTKSGMRLTGKGGKRNAYKVLVGSQEGKRPLV